MGRKFRQILKHSLAQADELMERAIKVRRSISGCFEMLRTKRRHSDLFGDELIGPIQKTSDECLRVVLKPAQKQRPWSFPVPRISVHVLEDGMSFSQIAKRHG